MKKAKILLAILLVLALSLTMIPFSGAVLATETADETVAANSYIEDGNLLKNAGFEATDTGDVAYGKLVTSGWGADYSQGVTYSISDDAHSGDKAVSFNIASDKDFRLNNGYNITTADVTETDSETGAVTTTLKAGITTGLDVDTTYVVSFWVKGNSTVRPWVRKPVNGGESYNAVTSTSDNVTADPNKWTLVSAEFSPNSLGQIWWRIFFVNNDTGAATTTLIDDAQLVTKEQAIANVNAMINTLEPTLADYEQRVDDIKQWVDVLGKDAIDYNAFVEKLSLYNSINNPGFEASTTATNATDDNGMVVTEGWLENQKINSGKVAYSIDTTEKHSGDKALKVEVLQSGVTLRLANPGTATNDYTVVVGEAYDETVPSTYTVSYWVKGTAYVRIAYWSRKTDDSGWDSMNWSADGNAGKQAHSEWTQYNVKVPVTTYNGKKVIRFVLAVSTGDTSDTSVTSWTSWIDDVELIREADVQEMIDNYTTGNTVLSSKIESAVTTFGTSKLSDYELYLQKKAGGYVYYNENNLFENPSFEVSDTFTSGSYGWSANNSNAFITEITADAHSGNNALLVTSLAYETKGENMIRNSPGATYGDLQVSNSTYLLSFWAKGDILINYGSYTAKSTTAWNTPNRINIKQSENEWTLYTVEITPTQMEDENYYIKWGVAPRDEQSDGTAAGDLKAYLDDFQLVTKDQAIANVEVMIDAFIKLDSTDANYARAKEDIEQWIAKGYVSDDAKVKFYNHLGDMDMDGDCDTDDVAVIRAHLLADGEFTALYNVNNDTVVDIRDMVTIDSKLV